MGQGNFGKDPYDLAFKELLKLHEKLVGHPDSG